MDAELHGLDLRRQLGRVRDLLGERVAAGESIEADLRALAERDRVAVAELLVGPRATPGGPMVRSALAVVDVLERAIAPNALYRRLADLAGGAGLSVLETAVARHPDAAWLVGLSARVEGAHAGVVHLTAVVERAGFADACLVYARAGHLRGLVDVAEVTGHFDVLSALGAAGAADALALAAARVVDRDPGVPMVAWLAAIWGPDPGGLLLRLADHLRSKEAARALARQAAPYRLAAARLEELAGPP